MQYYAARELLGEGAKPTGLYHYTSMLDKRVFPVGYCAQDCPGHTTSAEACDHYRQYILDKIDYTRRPQHAGEARKCRIEGCENLTRDLLEIDGHHYVVCNDHCNPEGADKLIWAKGTEITATSSY